MTAAPFFVEPLRSHDRAAFSCGVEALDRYFQAQVGQDIRRHVTACFVAVERTSGAVAGYYTLSAGEVALSDLPPELAKKLPRYPLVPVAKLGRLAIGRNFQGRKLGAELLMDAARRAARSEIAVYALAVGAKDESAEAFYLHHGFRPFGPRKLIAPISLLKEPPP